MRGNIRRYISALHYSGVDVSSIQTLKELASFGTFKIGMRWFRERNGKKTSKVADMYPAC